MPAERTLNGCVPEWGASESTKHRRGPWTLLVVRDYGDQPVTHQVRRSIFADCSPLLPAASFSRELDIHRWQPLIAIGIPAPVLTSKL
jgi:hypothetical protein